MPLLRSTSLLAILGTVLVLTVTNAHAFNDTASRLKAQTSSRGVNNGTWWVKDSMSISYAWQNRLDPGTQLYFSSSYNLNWRWRGKVNYYYSGPGKMDSLVGYSWDGSSFNLDSRSIVQTNAAGQIMDRIDQNIIPATTNLGNFMHQTFSYNTAGLLTDDIMQNWNTVSSSWYNLWHYFYTLNSQNKIINDTRQFWDTARSVWVNSVRYDTIYNTAGSGIIETKISNWNSQRSTWDESLRWLYTNNASGQHQSSIYQSWDTLILGWKPTDSHVYTYDAQDNLATDIQAAYNTATTTFDSIYKTDYTYNNFNQVLTSIVLPRRNGQWTLTEFAYRDVYYYELYSATGISSTGIPGLTLTLYPIPAADKLMISLVAGKVSSYKLSVTDIQGRVYEQMNIPARLEFKGQVATSHLAPGNYMLTIQDENGNSETRRFVVAR